MKKYKLHLKGWIPDLPDHRDFLYLSKKKKLKSIQSIDLRKNFVLNVFNQGNLGSCTGNAISAAFNYMNQKDNNNSFIGSRLFVYYNERKIENTISQDSGAQIRDGIKSLVKQGICLETKWVYDITKFAQKPSSICYKDAKKDLIKTYKRLDNTNKQELVDCLLNGFPFVFGFTVYESFESDVVTKTGIVPMPKKNEKVLGGHAVLCMGYDKNTDRFIVQNSWGTQWGQQGFFTIPAAYITNINLADDFWVINN